MKIVAVVKVIKVIKVVRAEGESGFLRFPEIRRLNPFLAEDTKEATSALIPYQPIPLSRRSQFTVHRSQ